MARFVGARRLQLTRREREALQQLVRRGRTGLWLGVRARAMLLAASGESTSAVARRVQRDRKWVRTWLARFAALGLAGLRDAPRPGRPPKRVA